MTAMSHTSHVPNDRAHYTPSTAAQQNSLQLTALRLKPSRLLRIQALTLHLLSIALRV